MKSAALTHVQVPEALRRRGIDEVLVFQAGLRHRFRRIEVRDGLLLHGEQGWGECSPFWDYGATESASWLHAGLEAATRPLPAPVRDLVEVNVTIPVVSPTQARRLIAASGGCMTAKVKVADPGSDLRQDCARVAAARAELGPEGRIRVDANAAWSVDEAVAAVIELDAAAEGLEYVEQPCPSVEELARVRRRITVPVAADESVRRADDPVAVARAGAADIVIVKAQPLGGVARALDVVDRSGLDAVVSSALDTSVGLGIGTALAASLPRLGHACGLATIELFTGDVTTSPLLPEGGALVPRRVEADQPVHQDVPRALVDRWVERLTAICHEL
ncbi:o-succinylbenzoate synthase [Propionibacterium freudenreichii]|uniref:o-succinylbenzoate synthase n=1 Tax=Propionibacterium freudenreichii TaxID=1744 RepID=UPI00254E184F|nr:o-succinylbenzoate synthase [Propionibacterium freudenreichii]MDK9332323.1 o-succinylbenzoate synthase [Propionibacterium freudenreichii]